MPPRNTSDLVSIVVTLYNYRHYIRDLIESVLNQTHTNWELIIVDDGSTDKPMKVIEPYLENKRIRYIRRKVNQGYSSAKNLGIIKAKGEYIVMIDADDMLTKSSLEIRQRALASHPHKLWCHGEVQVLDEKVHRLSDRSRNWKKRFREKLIREGWDLNKVYHTRLVHAQSVMVRKELHRKLGLYDEVLPFSADSEMWDRIIMFGYVPVYVEDYVAIYRVHSAQMHNSKYKKDRVPVILPYRLAATKRRFAEGINKKNTKLLPILPTLDLKDGLSGSV